MARKTRHDAWTLRDIARRARLHAAMLDRHAATLVDDVQAWATEERAREMRRFAAILRRMAKTAGGVAPSREQPNRKAEIAHCACEACVAFRRQVAKARTK